MSLARSDNPGRSPLEKYGLLGLASIGALATSVYALRSRRIINTEYITPNILSRKRRIKGICVKVVDADGIRIFHTPFPRWFWKPPVRSKSIKPHTIAIRLSGVDAPEMAHFGHEAQPFSAEAFDHLSALTKDRLVHVDMLAKDHVGTVYVRRLPWPWLQSVNLSLVKAGLAVVYRGQDARYGREQAELEKAEDKARRARVGIWSQNAGWETPAEYKKRHKIQEDD